MVAETPSTCGNMFNQGDSVGDERLLEDRRVHCTVFVRETADSGSVSLLDGANGSLNLRDMFVRCCDV